MKKNLDHEASAEHATPPHEQPNRPALAHTPGPWFLHGLRVDSGQGEVARVTVQPCIGGTDDLAAERGMRREQANARLVAASPDMYDALVKIASESCSHPGFCYHQIARAALAKAKGAA